VYRQHYNSSLPLQLLSEMKVGVLHPDDLKELQSAQAKNSDDNDPYARDPPTSPVLRYHQKTPCNAEVHLLTTTIAFITANNDNTTK